MAEAQSTMLNAESQRNLVERKINLSNRLRFRKGRGFCVISFQERYSDIKRMGDSEMPQMFTILHFYKSSPIKHTKQLHKT